MSRRAEFTAQTKRILAARTGHRCSFPGCLQVTSGPSADGPDKHINLGEACHIRGAKKGSKHYDPSMSPEQRSDFIYGIWMCGKHHRVSASIEGLPGIGKFDPASRRSRPRRRAGWCLPQRVPARDTGHLPGAIGRQPGPRRRGSGGCALSPYRRAGFRDVVASLYRKRRKRLGVWLPASSRNHQSHLSCRTRLG